MDDYAYSEEFRLACLARWLLEKNTLTQRRAFLSRMRSSGRDTDQIETALLVEHAAKYQLDPVESDEPLNEHETKKAALLANRESYARLAADHIGPAEPATKRTAT